MEVEVANDDVSNHRKTNSRRKTWSELRQEIRSIRRHLSTVSGKIPSYFEFKEMVTAENDSRFYRIYFLSSALSHRETTLLYCDVPVDCATRPKGEGAFQWLPLLDTGFQLPHHSQGNFSREEQLQWERKRVVSWGITSFDYQPAVGRFVFPASGSAYYCDDDFQKPPPLCPRELKHTESINSHLNPQMCPWNANLIAYNNNCDLWVHNVVTSSDIRLTHARKGNIDLSEDPVSAGMPSYVTQEEFNRYTGFWWQPLPVPSGSDVYRILYEEVDESNVDLIYLPCFGDEKEMEVFRFPRAGSSNAKSKLKISQFRFNSSNQLEVLPELHLKESLKLMCPYYEYLVRSGWTPDGKHVWAILLDRDQCFQQLVLLPLSSFVPKDTRKNDYSNHVDASPFPQVIYEEKSDIWINVHDILYFFSQEGNMNEITFLWASEETGFRHLYVITVELFFPEEVNPSQCHEIDPSKRLKRKIAVTSGEWEVSEADVWVNEKKRIVYFIGLKDSPLERHLYAADLDTPQEPVRLTNPGFSHHIAMNDDCTLFVSLQSSMNSAPSGQVYQIYYSVTYPFKVNVQALGSFLEPTTIPPSYRLPELFTHRLLSGHLIYGMLFKPPNMKSGEKYPTVLTIYGGPEVQLVTNSFKGVRHLRQYLLSSQGYVVISVDCRGSRNRGVQFESHIKGRLVN